MKKLFYTVVAISALMFASCADDEVSDTTPGYSTSTYADSYHIDIWTAADGTYASGNYVLSLYNPVSVDSSAKTLDLYGSGTAVTGYFAYAAITKGKYYYAVNAAGTGFAKYQIYDNESIKLVSEVPFQTNVFSTGTMVEGCVTATHAWAGDNLVLIQYNSTDKLAYWVKLDCSGTSMKFVSEGSVNLHSLYSYEVSGMETLKGENYNVDYPQSSIDLVAETYTTPLDTTDPAFVQEINKFSSSGHMRYRESTDDFVYVTSIHFMGTYRSTTGTSYRTNRGPLAIVTLNSDMTVKDAKYCDEVSGLLLESYGDTTSTKAFVDESSDDIYFTCLSKESSAYVAMGSVAGRAAYIRVKSGETTYDSTYGDSGAFDPGTALAGVANSTKTYTMEYAHPGFAMIFLEYHSDGMDDVADEVGQYVLYNYKTGRMNVLHEVTTLPSMISFYNWIAKSGTNLYFWDYSDSKVYSYDTNNMSISEVVTVDSSISMTGIRAMQNN